MNITSGNYTNRELNRTYCPKCGDCHWDILWMGSMSLGTDEMLWTCTCGYAFIAPTLESIREKKGGKNEQ